MKNALKKLDGAELNGRRIKLIEDYRGSKRRRYGTVVTIVEPPIKCTLQNKGHKKPLFKGSQTSLYKGSQYGIVHVLIHF